MDVHPPHEPVHSWRDALIHIALMTVGLFIALMLEGVVEYVHHRELVNEARENIHRELEGNQKALQGDIASVARAQNNVKAAVATLRFLKNHRDARGQSIGFAWTIGNLSDAAWSTARDTGALGYMPYAEVQSDASVYQLQAYVNTQILALTTRQSEALAPIAMTQDGHLDTLSDTDFDRMIQNASVNAMDLLTVGQLMQGLDQSYKDALRRQ